MFIGAYPFTLHLILNWGRAEDAWEHPEIAPLRETEDALIGPWVLPTEADSWRTRPVMRILLKCEHPFGQIHPLRALEADVTVVVGRGQRTVQRSWSGVVFDSSNQWHSSLVAKAVGSCLSALCYSNLLQLSVTVPALPPATTQLRQARGESQCGRAPCDDVSGELIRKSLGVDAGFTSLRINTVRWNGLSDNSTVETHAQFWDNNYGTMQIEYLLA